MILYKYHSSNNTFLITNYCKDTEYNNLSKKLCELYSSDGLIVFKNDPMKMFLYNKDGSEAMMCGNGIATLVNYLYDLYGIYNYFEIETLSGNYECEIISKKPFKVKVSLGVGSDYLIENIKINEKEYKVILFTLGVKHAIHITSNFSIANNLAMEMFDYYNGEYNVDIIESIDDKTFNILTLEKGVGFTKSCGTGSAASAYALYCEMNASSYLKAISLGGVTDVIIDDEIYIVNETHFLQRYEI